MDSGGGIIEKNDGLGVKKNYFSLLRFLYEYFLKMVGKKW